MSSRISTAAFVSKSLGLNLFFLRIMKEHSFFLQAGFVQKNQGLIDRANLFRLDFEELLEETVDLANGNVSRRILHSGEVVTDKTIAAEEKTQFLSGVPFNLDLTRRELMLRAGKGDPNLAEAVEELNERIIQATMGLIELKTDVLEGMLDCTLFTFNYPLLVEHIRREAQFFIAHLQSLQMRVALDPTAEILEEKIFWDRIMAEHSLFIAHLLDPTENDLINAAHEFAALFFDLEGRALQVERSRAACIPSKLLRDEIAATRRIRDFNDSADQLILDCEIRSIIIPLLADHVLRESNHFLALLTSDRTRPRNRRRPCEE